MSYLSPKDRYWHRVYEALPSQYVGAIDIAFQSMRECLRVESEDDTLIIANDDRAECVVGAITRYLCESNPDNLDFQRAIEIAPPSVSLPSIMSTSYSAAVMYAYPLPRTDLIRHIPNPLWGKHRFDPNTGEKVAQFTEQRVELELKSSGDRLQRMTGFTRFDTGYEDRDHVLLGVKFAHIELSCGAGTPVRLSQLSEDQCTRIASEAKKMVEKAGLTFDGDCMGYYLAGYVG